jgi:hypothetical protein
MALSATLFMLSPAAQAAAWVRVDQDTGFGRAAAAGWTQDYRYVRFYGGHNRGVAGQFGAAWRVVCNGGFTFSRSAVVRDTSSHYWGDIVRIPRNQGRCRERVIVRDSGGRMLAGIEAR